MWVTGVEDMKNNQISLHHLLMCSRWFPSCVDGKLDLGYLVKGRGQVFVDDKIDLGYLVKGVRVFPGEACNWEFHASIHWDPTREDDKVGGEAWWYGKGRDFTWREGLWHTAMWCRGLEGLKMISWSQTTFDPDSFAWEQQCEEWMKKVESVTEEPERVSVGKRLAKDSTYASVPFLVGDLRICLSSPFA
jgi:hypothetical protein